MSEPLVLKPGETCHVEIGSGLFYDVVNTGWVLSITSSRDMGVKPESARAVSLFCMDPPAGRKERTP